MQTCNFLMEKFKEILMKPETKHNCFPKNRNYLNFYN